MDGRRGPASKGTEVVKKLTKRGRGGRGGIGPSDTGFVAETSRWACTLDNSHRSALRLSSENCGGFEGFGRPRLRPGWVRAALVLVLVMGASGARAEPFDHQHGAWTQLLRSYDHDGRVDYAAWKTGGRAALDAYLSSLEAVTGESYASWTREQRLAYWINAYNAYMVKLVLDHYPLGSVREIGLLPFAAFKDHFIPLEKLRGEKLSLDDVENRILRKEIGEQLIHFGIVCASRSCPVLRNEAYRASEVMAQLEAAARSFLASDRNRFDPEHHKAELSSIFKWFHEDFERTGTLLQFVARYAPPAVASHLAEPGWTIEYLDYDWSLNGL